MLTHRGHSIFRKRQSKARFDPVTEMLCQILKINSLSPASRNFPQEVVINIKRAKPIRVIQHLER